MYEFQNLWELFSRSSNTYQQKLLQTYRYGLALKKESYTDVFERILRLSQYFESLKISPQSKIIFYIPTTQNWTYYFFTCMRFNLVVIPIDLDSSQAMIDQIISETKPQLIIETKSNPLIYSKKFSVQKIIVENVNFSKYQSISDPVLPFIKATDLAEIIYTSGTTGKPKGVMLTHQNIVTNLKNTLQVFPIEPGINMLEILPLSHLYAQMITFGILTIGGSINFITEINGETIRLALKTRKINALPVVPLVLIKIKNGIEARFAAQKLTKLLQGMQILAEKIKIEKLQRILFYPILKELGGALKIVIIGGASVPPYVYQWWANLGVRLYKGYGATETGPVISFEDNQDRDAYSVGRPLNNQECKIENGEILTKGLHVSPGYFKNPEKTKEVFTADGWYHTGDLGYIQAGKLYVQGRKKDMIVRANGMNVFPQDIEIILNKMQGIEDSCIVGINDSEEGEQIWAVLLTKLPLPQITTLINEVNKKLSIYQQINQYWQWPEPDFPRTHTKKIKTLQVKEQITKHIQTKISSEIKIKAKSKKINLQMQLKEILLRIARRPDQKISMTTKILTELDIDSLDRAELCAAINAEIHKDIPESKIDFNTTFAELLELVIQADEIKKNQKIIAPDKVLSGPIGILIREIIIRPLVLLIIWPFFRLKFNGKLPADPNKQYILIANHHSRVDTIFMFLLPFWLRKKIVIIANEDFNHGFANHIRVILMKLFVNVIVVGSNNSAHSTLQTLAQYLNNGFSLLQFPQGHRTNPTIEQSIKFQRGIANIVKDFQYPVYALKIKGLEAMKDQIISGWRKRVSIHVSEIILTNFQDEKMILQKLEAEFNKEETVVGDR
ncbi:MAG: AMP-binding protein [bacterium]